MLLAFLSAATEPPKPCQGSDLSQIEGLAAAEAARADDLINGDGLFWRIEKPGLAPSYLFGTIHSTDESTLEIARRAARSINGSNIVANDVNNRRDAFLADMQSGSIVRTSVTFDGAIDREKIEKFTVGLAFHRTIT